jgi:hypothetical protein
MIPSPEELSEGQRAYRRLELYQRNRPTLFYIVMTTLALAFLVCGASGQYWKAMWQASVITILICAWLKIKGNARKDFEFLKQLKLKYGPEVYNEVKKESASLQYKLLQKSYPLGGNRTSIRLP